MKIYSTVRIGNAYVVRAGEKSILKIASLRRATRLVADAAELLAQPAPPLSPEADTEPASTGDPGIIPDPGAILDPGVIPDPSEVS